MSDIAPPNREQRWYVDVDSKIYGPYDRPTIARLVERGQITAADFVTLQGSSDWIEITQEPALRGLFKTLRRANTTAAEPPVRRRRRRWGGPLFAIASFAVAAWMAWPYYAVLSLMQAARDGDASTLEKRVDWNSFRQKLRGDLNAQLLKDVRRKDGADAMASGFAAVLGPAVINQMIDGYVTPQVIAALAKSESSGSLNGKTPEGIDKSASLVRRIEWDQVKYAFFAGSPFSFRVDILPKKDPAIHSPIGLEFAWSGDWRLTHIILPDDVFESDKIPEKLAGATLPTAPKPAAIDSELPPITVSMQSKRFRPADVKSREYEAAIVFELSIVNQSGKPVRAFDGVITFTDLLDNEVLSSKLAINDAINSGSTYNWTGELKYNQFLDDHNRFKNEQLANLKTRFAVRKILFADGTSKTFP